MSRKDVRAEPSLGSPPDVGELSEVVERLEQLERRLIGQEHRILPILADLRREPRMSDKWWQAIVALASRLFLASPVVTAGATTLAVAGLWLAYVANKKLDRQNRLIEKQNAFWQQQIKQEADRDDRARKAEYIKTIYDVGPCPPGQKPVGDDTGCAISSTRARVEAARALAEMDRSLTDLSKANLATGVVGPVDWRGVSLRSARLRSVSLGAARLGRADLRESDLSGSSLAAADLSAARLVDADLSGASLQEASLCNADLTGAKLAGADLRGADLTGAKLERADLTGCEYCPSDTRHATTWPRAYKPAGCSSSTSCDGESWPLNVLETIKREGGAFANPTCRHRQRSRNEL